jgi:hypothetical protein
MSNDPVLIQRSDLRRLVEAADILAAHCATLRNTPEERTGVDTFTVLAEAGLIDPATQDLNTSFRSTLVAAGAALSGRCATVVPFPAAAGFGGA